MRCGSAGIAIAFSAIFFLCVSLAATAAPATRVVALAPSLTELVHAAGAGEKLVAVSAYSDYPASARALPEVADAAGIAWERLIGLKPDLVLAWAGGTRPMDIARLRELGIPFLVVEVAKLDDVPRVLRDIGRRAGTDLVAEQAATAFERDLGRLRAASIGKRRVRAFFEISRRPMMTVNGRHVISEVLNACGGENVFADASALAAEPSREELLVRAPEVILYGRSRGDAARDDRVEYGVLPAWRDGKIYSITADYVFRPGPRLLRAAEEVCAALDRARGEGRAAR